MELQRLLILSFLAAFHLLVLIHGQSQSGFISIDCGLPGNSSYREPLTGLTYVSDSAYIHTGEPRNVSDIFMTNTLQQQLATVRTFPQGSRNCYTVNVKVGTRYLIRASFLYADFDGKNTTPSSFDLHFGPNFWATVALPRVAAILHEEIIHTSGSSYAQVCLVNTGSGTPFISSLEFRPLRNDTYSNLTLSLQLSLRLDFGSNSPPYRYPSDVYDRVWTPAALRTDWTSINTSSTIAVDDPLGYFAPSVVMSTASTPLDISATSMDFNIPIKDPNSRCVAYLYFAEVVQLQTNQSRSFHIFMNGALLLNQIFSPVYLSETVVYTLTPVSNNTFMFSLKSSPNSTLPPLLNAFEIYSVLNLPHSATDQDDVDAITGIKSTYQVVKNWQGDPCAPVEYVWQGVTCNSARITALDLSSSGLTGGISFDILNLKMLDTLDLSNNNLTGSIPDFLAQLPKLKVLNLAKNNLSGSVPASLTEKSNSGGLSLHLSDNPNLSTTTTPSSEKKSSNVVVAVVASVVGVFALVLIVLGVLFCMRRRNEQRGAAAGRMEVKPGNRQAEPWEMKKHQYSYSEVVTMTDNFKKVLGEGGFGKVYYGRIADDDTEVAVKMLSLSSSQGYQQFQAEVELLMRVHHRNLISLVGYCNEGPHMGLIYEYMNRGNLGSLLADEKASLLTWEKRLHIALDAAQGLEYLHNGSRPAMVHRDVKCANILLNDIFQAKLADFGLTRSFPTEGGATHITTNVVGTPGYLDPEYYVSYRLNEKSDVYSFGIVILEIVTGRPVLVKNHEKSHITQWVEFMLSEGDISAIIDPRMKMDYDVNSICKAVEVAISSASQSSARRPTMSEVVKDLRECLNIEIANKTTQSAASVSSDLASGWSSIARYQSDVYDRVWTMAALRTDWTSINTSSTIAVDDPLGYFPPSVVMSTASTPLDISATPMDFRIQTEDPNSRCVVYLYFAEVVQLQTYQSRSFHIFMNGALLQNESVSPDYLSTTVVFTPAPISNNTFMFSFKSTPTSTLPPLLNALEIYSVLNLPHSATDEDDVDAITGIKSTYEVARNWQGDPCAPVEYVWQGVTCNYDNGHIISGRDSIALECKTR